MGIMHEPDGSKDCLRNQIAALNNRIKELDGPAGLGSFLMDMAEAVSEANHSLDVDVRDATKSQMADAYIKVWRQQRDRITALEAERDKYKAEAERCRVINTTDWGDQ